MAKYVVMIETDREPDPGNCDSCEFCCPHHMSWFDKQMIMDHDNIKCLHLHDFYCPIKAVVDVETFLKWKQEHPGFGDPLQIGEKK